MNTSNIRSDNGILASDHYLTALFNDVIKLVRVVARTFLNAEKSVGSRRGVVVTSLIQSAKLLYAGPG